MNHSIIKIGDALPDFVLPDHHNKMISTEELRGKNILLSFHPLAWTDICARQMRSLENKKTVFDKLNTIAVGISIDSVPSKKAWAEKELGIKHTRLLADFWPHGRIAMNLGIFREKDGFSERANIICNEKGIIEFVKIYDISSLPDIEEILMFLEKQEDT
jgi:peroxiredoxin